MKKLLSFIFYFSLITSNLFAGTLEIDNMEYSSDATAQSNYVSNSIVVNPVAHWKMNDNAATTAVVDSKNAYNGFAARNTSNITVAGKINTALSFNGSSDFIDLGTSFPASDVFSLCFWMGNKGTDKVAYIWARNTNRDTWANLGIVWAGSNLHIATCEVAPSSIQEEYVVASYASISNGDHLAFVFNYPTCTVYKNGNSTPIATLTFTFHFNMNSGANTVMGRGGAYNDYYFDGTLDDVRYYSSALSAADIAKIYNAGTGTELDFGIQSYSESTIKTQGSYSLKAVAAITDSLNKTLTKTFAVNSNLIGVKNLRFDAYALRTGSNFKIGLHDTGGTTTEITPNIATSNTWQPVNWDWSAVSDANKDNIDTCTITITNADSANTIYLDSHEIAQAIDVFGMVN